MTEVILTLSKTASYTLGGYTFLGLGALCGIMWWESKHENQSEC